MAKYHEFSEDRVAAAIEAARSYYEEVGTYREGGRIDPTDDGHMNIAAECIQVTVENGKVCLKLPVLGNTVCLPIPSFIPNGTAAEACLSICFTGPFPTGVTVTISVLGKVIITKSFGKC